MKSMDMLLILAQPVTERLEFTVDLIFKQMLGLDAGVTFDPKEYTQHDGSKLEYGMVQTSKGLFLKAHGLLGMCRLEPVEPRIGKIEQYPVIFLHSDPVSMLPFDPLAAVFYMVTRYEEYLPSKRDRFDRFQATETLAWKHGFYDMPVVHHWVEMIRAKLANAFPGMVFHSPSYCYRPTIDIDHAWCYLGRPLFRTLGGFGRSLISGKFREITARICVLAGIADDPYDTYAFIEEVHRDTLPPCYFILYADYGGNDNNVKVSTLRFRKLINDLDKHNLVGIHPSLASGDRKSVLKDEISGLATALNRTISKSRQHFLRLSFPETYRQLLECGITDDYSLGFPSQPGFRAGIAMPYPFFDLLENRTTPLVIHPVIFMDVTFKDYLRLNPVQSLEVISDLVKKVKEVNGELVTIWHNESFDETGRWHGWRNVYKEMVKLAST